MIYDELPAETRRRNFGWFGEPWPGSICYDDAGRLRADMRTDFPHGEDCPICLEPIVPGESGKAVPHLAADGAEIRHAHKECLLREVLGPPDHLDGRCTCLDPDRPKRPFRVEALELWARATGTRPARPSTEPEKT